MKRKLSKKALTKKKVDRSDKQMLILLIFIGFIASCLLELKDMYLATYEMEEAYIQEYENTNFFKEDYISYGEDDEEGYVLARKYTYAS